MMEIESLLEKHSKKMELSLSELLGREMEKASEYHPFIKGLYESMREFILRGGKENGLLHNLAGIKGLWVW